MLVKNREFFEKVAEIIEQARAHVGRTVDLTMCISYFEIGRMIIEQEQKQQSMSVESGNWSILQQPVAKLPWRSKGEKDEV